MNIDARIPLPHISPILVSMVISIVTVVMVVVVSIKFLEKRKREEEKRMLRDIDKMINKVKKFLRRLEGE